MSKRISPLILGTLRGLPAPRAQGVRIDRKIISNLWCPAQKGVTVLIALIHGQVNGPQEIRQLWRPLFLGGALIAVPLVLARERRSLVLLGAAAYVVVRLGAAGLVWGLSWLARHWRGSWL